MTQQPVLGQGRKGYMSGQRFSTQWLPPVAQRQLSQLARGVRVQVRSSNDQLNNQKGTIIDSTSTPNWDCIVKIDLIDTPLSFYWQEITVL